jgi:hypothetical protein
MKRDNRQPGLEMRVDREARRISNQHRQLDEFYGMVVSSLEGGMLARARSEFVRFHDALEAHFQVEEQIHFPALHGLAPELDAELASLVEEHREFRERLERLAELFERGDAARCGRELDGLVVELATHEGREERIGRHVAGRNGRSSG